MSHDMRRVLVAGATGYLGGFVAQEFKRRGYFVRALARSPQKLDPIRDSLDDVFQAEITRPETLDGACDGMDVVFSSVGITKQKGKLTFRDVDYRGNKNLLEIAQRAGVGRFVYVSVFRGPSLLHLDIVKAHEDFVAVLRGSGLSHAVIRPTGFFSDMGAYMKMAKKGRVYLFGDGNNRINPIHGADLAEVCVDAAENGTKKIEVGGPEVLRHREIARLALSAAGKPERITPVPVWMIRGFVSLSRIFNRHRGELLAFMTEALTGEGVAPRVGTRRLADHFRVLAVDGSVSRGEEETRKSLGYGAGG